MKERHTQAERVNARAVLAAANIDIGQSYYTLRSSQVDALIAEANRVRYQKPKDAKGSRGRYFHDMLQRRAK